MQILNEVNGGKTESISNGHVSRAINIDEEVEGV